MSFNVENFDFGLNFSQVQVAGLDKLQSVELLKITGPQTIHNRFKFEKISLILKLNFDLMLAFDKENIGNIQLCNLIQSSKILHCVLSTAKKIKITNLQITIGNIEIRGTSINEHIDSLIQNTTKVIYDDIKKDILKAIPFFLIL